MTKQKFWKHVIQSVVDNGLALTVQSSPSFTSFTELLAEMFDKLGVSLERESIRNMILREAFSQFKVWYILLVLCTRYISFSGQLQAHQDNWKY